MNFHIYFHTLKKTKWEIPIASICIKENNVYLALDFYSLCCFYYTTSVFYKWCTSKLTPHLSKKLMSQKFGIFSVGNEQE